MNRLSQADELALRARIKRELRHRRLAVRQALPDEARDQRSRAIKDRLVALPEWEAANTVLAFVSMDHEVQTHEAVYAAWDSKKRVAAPRMADERGALELKEWLREDQLEQSELGFSQPSTDANTVADDDVDLVLVPALAADARGHRLGFGLGFYDRLLPRLQRATRIGLVFDFEILAELPNRPEDQPVDIVVTDVRALRAPPRG